jgi:cytochrome c oxidase subunit 2
MDQQQAAQSAIEHGTFWLPKQGSTLAPIIDQGWDLAYWVSVVFFILVVVPMGLFVYKYRRQGDKHVGEPAGHSTALEIGWSVVPLAIVMACFIVGFKGFLAASVAPAESLEIKATAQKWSWTFDYGNGKSSPGELVVPVGKPVKMLMSSKDVLHSFYIPLFRVKQDVIPGSYSSVWFEAVEPGETTLECTEYCGKDHSMMLAKVRVLSQEAFDQWLNADEFKGMAPADIGAKLYTKYTCNTCHSVDGSKIVGPTFKGIWGREEQITGADAVKVDENYIRESILNPNAKVVAGYPPVMPSFKGQLKDEQIDALIAYMKTLQ